VSKEPSNFSYGYDALYYLKAGYVLDRLPFYKALMTAIKYDNRTPSDYVDKNYRWKGVPNMFYIRQPFIFYFWKFIGQGNFGRVVYISIIFCLFLIILSFYSANTIIGKYSFASPIIIYPFLFIGTTWANVFFPDWWAALFYLSGFLFWISRKYWPSAIFFLFAVMSRGEVMGIAYLIFFLSALFKKKEARKPFVIVTIFFAIWFGIHLYRASFYIHPSAVKHGIDFYISRIVSPLFTTSASYMMFLYGYFKIPLIIFPLSAFFISFMKKYYELTILSFYYVIHNTYHSSSYWGQHLTLVILFISSLFFGLSFDCIKSQISQIKKLKSSIVITTRKENLN